MDVLSILLKRASHHGDEEVEEQPGRKHDVDQVQGDEEPWGASQGEVSVETLSH